MCYYRLVSDCDDQELMTWAAERRLIENEIKSVKSLPKHKKIRKRRRWKCPDVTQTWRVNVAQAHFAAAINAVIIPGLRQSGATL